MTNVPNLQQLVSWIRVTVGPLVLPASEIPQIFTEHLLYTRGSHYSFGAPLCAPGHKHYTLLHLPAVSVETQGCRPSTSFLGGCLAEKKS